MAQAFFFLLARDRQDLSYSLLDIGQDALLGENAKSQLLLHATGAWTRTKTRTSAITHDFFLFSPRGNPQDWQPVRTTWRGDKPGRVVCVTWRAGLTWCPRVGAGTTPVLSLDQGDGPRTGTGFDGRWCVVLGWERRISSTSGLGRAWGFGFGVAHTHSWSIFGQDLSRIIPTVQERASMCPFPFFPLG